MAVKTGAGSLPQVRGAGCPMARALVWALGSAGNACVLTVISESRLTLKAGFCTSAAKAMAATRLAAKKVMERSLSSENLKTEIYISNLPKSIYILKAFDLKHNTVLTNRFMN